MLFHINKSRVLKSYSKFIPLPLIAVLLLLAPLTIGFTANPSSGTLSPNATTPIAWTGSATGGATPNGESDCQEGSNCESYTLTLSGNPSDWAGKLVHIKISWQTLAHDYALSVHKDSLSGPIVAYSDHAVNDPAAFEAVDIDPSASGTGVYVVRTIYFTATAADQYTGTASTRPKASTELNISPEMPPSFLNYAAPAGLGNSAGEPTLGVNWKTGSVMYIANTQTLRVTFDDSVSPANATWVNKSFTTTSLTSFDPILETNSVTGRTFVSQLLPNKISLMAYTDDDGATWTPSQGAGINSGVDHQTVGGGPFARNVLGIGPTTSYPHAVYYASQDLGVSAQIALSLDGGLTFGPAIPMYDLTECGGLHGHIKVAPDGTIYVPNSGCKVEQGVTASEDVDQALLVSEDNGLSWDIRRIPGTSESSSDPSVGIAEDGSLYFAYCDGDGHPRVAVSRDKGRTWTDYQDLGASHGVQYSVFPAAVAGDKDRAAIFFLGTTTPGAAAEGGDPAGFDGAWYGYIATTYDGGKTWAVVNATPNDPVQRGPICGLGTIGCSGNTRNLLDFNDVTVDKKGRVLAAYADGCITEECKRGVDKNGDGRVDGNDNDGARKATIIRQSGGKTLFSQYDPTPVVTTTSIEDNDPRVAYSNGWHLVNEAEASDSHFRLNNGTDLGHFAKLTFDVVGQAGEIRYNFAKSPKGGSTEVLLDGESQGVISYRGTQGTTRAPEYGYGISFKNLSQGQHTLELRAINGPVYIDGFVLKSATSSASPTSGPGPTSSNVSTLNAGGDLIQMLTLGAGAQQISVVAEPNINVPIRLVLIDPSGAILQTAGASSGFAVIERPVSRSGLYTVKIVNLGLGPVKVWSSATPLMAR